MELFGRMVQDDNTLEKHTINLLIELLDDEGQHEKVGQGHKALVWVCDNTTTFYSGRCLGVAFAPWKFMCD